MKRDPRVYLAHILEHAERIEQYTRGGKEAFLCDTMIQDAVIRNFEVIGEAAKRFPKITGTDTRTSHGSSWLDSVMS